MNPKLYPKKLFSPIIAKDTPQRIPSVGVPFWSDVWRSLCRNKLAMVGLVVIIVLVIGAIVGPYVTGRTYYEQDFAHKNVHPNGTYWFGTDDLGRDVFTRAWYGARISLFIGLMAAVIDFAMGVLYGGLSGFKGGRIDHIMMRISEVLYSIPYLLMVILLMILLGQGIWTIIAAMTITGWIPMARLVRGQVLQLREQEFILAAQSMNAGTIWILRKHLIPNMMAPILVHMTLTVPQAIFAEATLSFLGLGVPGPQASWGTMASESLASLLIGNVYQLFIPGFLISLSMFAFNVLGDGMCDALDPRQRKW